MFGKVLLGEMPLLEVGHLQGQSDHGNVVEQHGEVVTWVV